MADSDSESDSESDINKKKLLLREKQRKKISLTPSPWFCLFFLSALHTTCLSLLVPMAEKASWWQNDIRLRFSCYIFASENNKRILKAMEKRTHSQSRDTMSHHSGEHHPTFSWAWAWEGPCRSLGRATRDIHGHPRLRCRNSLLLHHMVGASQQFEAPPVLPLWASHRNGRRRQDRKSCHHNKSRSHRTSSWPLSHPHQHIGRRCIARSLNCLPYISIVDFFHLQN